MRFLLALVGLAALILIALLAFGMITINGKSGSLPTVKLEGGQAPEVNANMATVNFGTENKTVEVPTVTTTSKTIKVPTISVEKPATPPANSAAPQ
ncbi:hypothetical protein [Sphingomonas mali]|jgi:hypothetical protein|uniref:hypothetical protein n=1 Tax=Sphingomonas mali TaxID=40682 RepID=UPI00082CF074|nr:hypothetical protein [Sphingomonas mali]